MIVKKTLILLLCSVIAQTLMAQKPIIDSLAIVNWPIVDMNSVISDDGSYFSYRVDNKPAGSRTLVIQKTDNTWKKEFPGAWSCVFSGDNKQAVFQSGDTLFFLALGLGQPNYVLNVNTYKVPKSGEGKWLAYQLKNPVNELVLRNMFTGKEQHLSSVTDYTFDDKGNVLLLKTTTKQDSISKDALQWVNLSTNIINIIWSEEGSENGGAIGSYNLDANGSQSAFVVLEKKR